MNSIRVAVLCFVVSPFLAPQHALAQGGAANNLTAINARLTALEAAVAAETAARLAAEDKLKGNITANDLFGTYDVYLLGISMDAPGAPQIFNEMSSYAFTGTAVFTNDLSEVEGSFRGSLNGTIAGRLMIEQEPDQIWAAEGGSGPVAGGFDWSYSNNVLTITPDDGVEFNGYDLSVAVGGRVLVSARGGPPSNNQQLTVWTRRP